MRITIFGSSGLLGKALMRRSGAASLTGFSSRDADIRNPAEVDRALQQSRPDWTILAAAYTDVDGCESNRDLAFATNSRGARNVAEAAHRAGSRLLFVSTDYVFDGKKGSPYEADDSRAPQSVYGESKAEGELQVLQVLPECCIVRTAWLFGAGGRCFPNTILNLAATRNEIDVVTDQRGAPTYTDDLASALLQLCAAGAAGIVHATNEGECTWFDFAREIIAQRGLQTVVRPTTSDKFVRPAKRPAYSVLSLASLHRYGIRLPSWQRALHSYLAQLDSSSDGGTA